MYKLFPWIYCYYTATMVVLALRCEEIFSAMLLYLCIFTCTFTRRVLSRSIVVAHERKEIKKKLYCSFPIDNSSGNNLFYIFFSFYNSFKKKFWSKRKRIAILRECPAFRAERCLYIFFLLYASYWLTNLW